MRNQAKAPREDENIHWQMDFSKVETRPVTSSLNNYNIEIKENYGLNQRTGFWWLIFTFDYALEKDIEVRLTNFKYSGSDVWTLEIVKCNYLGITILGDPGAVSGGGKKSKRVRKNSGEKKSRRRRRAPGDKVLTDQFQTAGVILASDWCQKTFVFFCPITERQD